MKGPNGLCVALSFLVFASGCLAPPTDGPGSTDAQPATGQGCMTHVGDVNLERATILEIQDALRAGRITSVQLVEAYLARIAAFDAGGPKLNSVRAIHPGAVAQAAALDAERANGNVRGPLHGIPILLT